MIKAIIFDIDNTLIDFMSTKKTASAAAAKAMITAGLKDYPEDLADTLFSFYVDHGIESDNAFEGTSYKSTKLLTIEFSLLL